MTSTFWPSIKIVMSSSRLQRADDESLASSSVSKRPVAAHSDRRFASGAELHRVARGVESERRRRVASERVIEFESTGDNDRGASGRATSRANDPSPVETRQDESSRDEPSRAKSTTPRAKAAAPETRD